MHLLGRFFTYDVAVSAGQHVVELGPYRCFVTHLSGLAGGKYRSRHDNDKLGCVAFAALCIGAAYAYRIPIEEQALVKGLGAPYREYMRRTWRLIPFVY